MQTSKFVVGIGYSEGGLEPLKTFFDHTPHDQATYIILRHIPLDQRTTLQQILQRHSKLEIIEAEDAMRIAKDTVYIPPSSSYITIERDTLYLTPRVKEITGYNVIINTFLKSLARAKGKRSIAIFLSGGGMDGIEGALHIKQAGGIILVQDPSSCQHKALPSAIIEKGFANQILLPEQMPKAVEQYVNPILKHDNELVRLNAISKKQS